MNPRLSSILTGLLLAAVAHATPRTSSHYTIATEALDFGGQAVASSHYSIHGSVTSIIGISENSDPVRTVARHGFIGQLYDVLGFGILFTENYPPEGSTTQVIPLRTLDDNTHLEVPLADVVYSAPEGGPVESISSTGLITTSPIHEDTSALIRAVLTGVEGAVAELQIFVQNTQPDNYGSYAADGLPDAWQIDRFGHDNPLAAPLLDPDGDGHDNRFEHAAGIIPTDQNSRFLLRVDPVPGEPGRKAIVFSPRFPDRQYRVIASADLKAPWLPLGDSSTVDNGDERTVIDPDATLPRKFYQIEITKP